MNIFTNFEDWPKPVDAKTQTKGRVVNKENDKDTSGSEKSKKNGKRLEGAGVVKNGEQLKTRHIKKIETQEYTPEQIREKVEISKNMKDVSKNMKADRVSNSTSEDPENVAVIEERFSDVNKNDPNNPATIGKLKDLLSKGGVSFSEKERQVISKIIEE